MGAFLTMVLLFYFLVSGRQVARGLFWIVPPHRRPLVARIWQRLDPVLIRYFIGVLAVVVYAAVAAYIGLGVILGIEHAVFLALLDRHRRNRAGDRPDRGGRHRRTDLAAHGDRHPQHLRVCDLRDRAAAFDRPDSSVPSCWDAPPMCIRC